MERLADIIDVDIKYGGGPEILREVLIKTSDTIAEFEGIEIGLRDLLERGHDSPKSAALEAEVLRFKQDLQEALARTMILEEEAARKP